MIKLIIFDWDDVFSRGSIQGYYACYHQALLDVGVELDPQEEDKRIQAQWGNSHIAEIAELLKDRPNLIDPACAAYERHLFSDLFVSRLSVVPGSSELLERLSKQYTLAVASGVHPKLLKERVMPAFGMTNVFTQIVTAYDLRDSSLAKPHPHIAQTIMKKQGIKPKETIMIGDAKNDVLMARAAGIEPVVVLTGYLSETEAKVLGVRYIIPDVTKLETVLARL